MIIFFIDSSISSRVSVALEIGTEVVMQNRG